MVAFAKRALHHEKIMKVIHIIPSAFHYFDDIRNQAMDLVNAERKLGVDAEAFTLQYGAGTRREENIISQKAPGLNFNGLFSGNDLIKDLDNYDIVHLHCPFFGLAKDLLVWKKINPDKILVATVWREAKITDLFSVYIYLYNRRYLPKILSLCGRVIDKVHLTYPADELKLKHSDMEAKACVSFYSSLIS